MMFATTKRHVYLGKSPDYAYCGRYVGFHNSLSAVREAEVMELATKDTTAHLCKSCLRGVAADKRPETEAVRQALAEARDRRRARVRAMVAEREAKAEE